MANDQEWIKMNKDHRGRRFTVSVQADRHNTLMSFVHEHGGSMGEAIIRITRKKCVLCGSGLGTSGLGMGRMITEIDGGERHRDTNADVLTCKECQDRLEGKVENDE